jgi:hypothetical protein
MSPPRPAGAVLAVALSCLGAPAVARVLDPTVVNAFDLRMDAGLASPVGAVGGALSVPWRYFAIEAAGGVGLTGLNLSVMPKIIPLRWSSNVLMVGVAGTVALPHISAPMGRRRSTWLTAEVAYQRSIFIDNVFYLGAGLTRGTYTSQCLNEQSTMCPAPTKALWPEIRIGFGRRY